MRDVHKTINTAIFLVVLIGAAAMIAYPVITILWSWPFYWTLH